MFAIRKGVCNRCGILYRGILSHVLIQHPRPNEMGSGEAIQHRALSAPSRGIQRLETDRREDGLIILRILGKADRQTFLKVIRPVPTRIPRGLRHRKVETPQDAILARIRQKAQRVQNLVSNLVENA